VVVSVLSPQNWLKTPESRKIFADAKTLCSRVIVCSGNIFVANLVCSCWKVSLSWLRSFVFLSVVCKTRTRPRDF
jgi:hypothetical protein